MIYLGQKKPDITKISDRNYVMTTTFTSYGILTQQLWKINLPSAAGNVTQDKDAFGKAIFTYEMTPGHSGIRLLLIVFGVLLIAAAVISYIKPDLLTFGKSQKVKPFTVVSAQQAPAAIIPDPPANPDIEKLA